MITRIEIGNLTIIKDETMEDNEVGIEFPGTPQMIVDIDDLKLALRKITAK